MWKENIIEDLESRNLSYIIVREFLSDLKEEFGGEYNKTMKIAKLKKLKQRSRTMEEFLQEFKRAVRNSKYKRKLLVKEFKREINRVIRRKLMKVECPPRSIKQ